MYTHANTNVARMFLNAESSLLSLPRTFLIYRDHPPCPQHTGGWGGCVLRLVYCMSHICRAQRRRAACLGSHNSQNLNPGLWSSPAGQAGPQCALLLCLEKLLTAFPERQRVPETPTYISLVLAELASPGPSVVSYHPLRHKLPANTLDVISLTEGWDSPEQTQVTPIL